MTDKKRIETDEDLVNAVDMLFDDVIEEDPEAVDEILREAGLDPRLVAKQMAEFARKVSAESPLDWRNKRDQLEQKKGELSASTQTHRLNRKDMEARLQEILSKQPQDDLVLAYRNLDKVSDEDLESLLRQAEYLRLQQEKKRTHDDKED
jgi:hypothetical protein